ncbi:hypothetical protein BGZ95_002006, partial [Linnemannia exigua]
MSGQPRWWRQRIRIRIPSLPFLALLFLFAHSTLFTSLASAWPYVDCSGTNSMFNLGAVTAYIDPTNNTVHLSLQGNFSNAYGPAYYQTSETNQ